MVAVWGILFLAFAHALPLQSHRSELAIPSQIHTTLGEDTDNYVISWVTFEDQETMSVVEYGNDPEKLDQRATAVSKIFKNTCNISRALHDVSVTVPHGTAIYYHVSSGGHIWSGINVFTALNPHVSDFTFSLLGDMGINCAISSVPQLIADTDTLRHQMVLHYGDIAYNLDDQCGAVGDLFMNAVSGFAASVPVVFGVGNHETAANYTYVDYLQRYGGQSDLSDAAGSPSIRYLSMNIGLVHIAMVDTDAYIYPPVYPLASPQYAWLEADLKNVDRTVTPWLILIGHRAMYCDSTGSPECDEEAATIRNGLNGSFGLEPLMLKYGVDMYFAGHTHRYQREWPAAHDQLVQANYLSPLAPVHIQSGIGGVDGGDDFPTGPRPFTAYRDVQLNKGYGRIVVHNATHLNYQQVLAVNGTVLDSFTLVQYKHGPFSSLL